MAYVTYEYYTNTYGGTNAITESDLEKVSREIDNLTFNRIVKRGFDNLTDFQKEIIRNVTCHMADFEYENSALIKGGFSSYSINGVSMNFDKSAVVTVCGVTVPAYLYDTLKQTGLCCRLEF